MAGSKRRGDGREWRIEIKEVEGRGSEDAKEKEERRKLVDDIKYGNDAKVYHC